MNNIQFINVSLVNYHRIEKNINIASRLADLAEQKKIKDINEEVMCILSILLSDSVDALNDIEYTKK